MLTKMPRSLFLVLLTLGPAFAATPCTSATSACTEWVTFSGGPWRSMIYRTYSLDARNEQITRALVMVHGTNRDADNYYRNALASAFLANALEDTVVIAPRIASNERGCQDKLDTNEVSYSCGGDSWRSGGTSSSNPKLTSFDFIDEVLRKLANKQNFPNLQHIVVAGHSAGGQFVNRYEMANQVHEKLGVPVSYVVANPSSYAYPDNTRPMAADWTIQANPPGYIPELPAGRGGRGGRGATEGEAPGAAIFRPFMDGRNCTTYDQWPYGFEHRSGYTARLTDDELKKQLASRPTTYLVGELDILPLGGFDGSCPAMAQGPTRLARGLAFSKFVNQKLGAHQEAIVIPECGHNARCMFTDEKALPIVFPK
jgi:pimeloyl-ACP methyl ester carboxylesterase